MNKEYVIYITVKSKERNDFWDWCQKHDIICEYDSTGIVARSGYRVDSWRVIFKDRMIESLIRLRWS